MLGIDEGAHMSTYTAIQDDEPSFSSQDASAAPEPACASASAPAPSSVTASASAPAHALKALPSLRTSSSLCWYTSSLKPKDPFFFALSRAFFPASPCMCSEFHADMLAHPLVKPYAVIAYIDPMYASDRFDPKRLQYIAEEASAPLVVLAREKDDTPAHFRDIVRGIRPCLVPVYILVEADARSLTQALARLLILDTFPASQAARENLVRTYMPCYHAYISARFMPSIQEAMGCEKDYASLLASLALSAMGKRLLSHVDLARALGAFLCPRILQDAQELFRTSSALHELIALTPGVAPLQLSSASLAGVSVVYLALLRLLAKRFLGRGVVATFFARPLLWWASPSLLAWLYLGLVYAHMVARARAQELARTKAFPSTRV